MLHGMFEQPNPDMKSIAERAERELRTWLRQDVCAAEDGDAEEVKGLKEAVAVEFDGARPTAEILEVFLRELQNLLAGGGNAEATKLLNALQNTKGFGERVPLFLSYYGLEPNPGGGSDNPTSPMLKSFKAKYRSMFEQGIGNEDVEEEMRRDVGGKREQELGGLRKKLAGLELARSAAEKERFRREERARERKGKEKETEKEAVTCGLDGCVKEVDSQIEGGPVQCAVCDWLVAKGGDREGEGRSRAIYCSVEHAEMDFVGVQFTITKTQADVPCRNITTKQHTNASCGTIASTTPWPDHRARPGQVGYVPIARIRIERATSARRLAIHIIW